MTPDPSFASSTIQAYSFFALIGILGIAAVVLLIVSMRAQRKYNRDALPFIPEIISDAPQDDYSDQVEERTDVVTSSAFNFEEDDDSYVGDAVSASLLKDVQKRTEVTAPPKKASLNPFGKK